MRVSPTMLVSPTLAGPRMELPPMSTVIPTDLDTAMSSQVTTLLSMLHFKPLHLVVHNGIITNYKDIKQFLLTKGFIFESETDTEVIAKLVSHLAKENPISSFRQLVEQTISQLEGAFACVFKSSLFPGECVATRRGSPMVVGIKSGMIECI